MEFLDLSDCDTTLKELIEINRNAILRVFLKVFLNVFRFFVPNNVKYILRYNLVVIF